MIKPFLLLTLSSLLFTASSFSQVAFNDSDKDTIYKTYEFPQVDIIGQSPGLINRIPGSLGIVNEQDLSIRKPLTGNEVVRNIPGINVVDEEGGGLRLNMGIRGLDPDRSRTILMLEDGVPISLAPYGEPEMYYTPPIDRMSGIQILKGSGSILFGPQTIGGVVNFITADPPAGSVTNIDIRGGENGYFSGQLKYGTTVDNAGVQINLLHKQADKLGTVDFNINDVTGKVKLIFSDRSRLGVKLSAYDETSNSTYVGITQVMYDRGEYYPVIAPADKLDIRRYSGSITHEYRIGKSSLLKTTAFGYTTSRNWRRQDFGRTSSVTNQTGVVFGDTTVSGGAIFMRNSTGNRDRQFDVAGIEPRFYSTYYIGKIKNEIDGGFRFLYEKAFEQRINGTRFDAETGTLRDYETRTGNAYTAFVQNRFHFNDKLSVTPGLRLESFSYNRDITRINNRDTSIFAESDIFSVVPGIGINYFINNSSSLFAGIHRGFAPPRVKDAINNGEAMPLDAELSWNSELGARLNLTPAIYFELTGYRLDFENQIIPVSVSSSGAGTGLVNGGETVHMGIESAFSIDFGKLMNSRYNIIASSSFTFGKAEYSSDRYVMDGSDSVNVNGNRLPYSPELIIANNLELIAPFGASLLLSGSYVSEQFADELNTETASNDGLKGVIPSHLVFDVTGKYMFKSLGAELFVSVKNLTDERYIASRRPEGIKVGLPRTFIAGLSFTL